MDKINLCIDIGNTSTKAALYDNGIETKYFKPFTVDDLKSVRQNKNISILVSKTGENLPLEKELNELNFVSHTTSLPIKLDYKTPQTLGRDRIATAVGAYHIEPSATWLIIDLGTCLTMDLLVDGSFRGGLISPGVQMRFKAMHDYTAGLPLVEMDYSQTFPGKSTEESLQVGVCQSIVNEIQGYIRQLDSQFDNLKIVDCSSLKLHFVKELKSKIFARPKLVLEGLNNIIEYNANK